MKFKFHLYVQKHSNRTYTATVLPFYDINSYGINLEEIKLELSEAIKKRVEETPSARLHRYEFDSNIYLHKAEVEIRPVDRKKRNKRREKVKLFFSLLVTPQEDGQLYVTVPKLGPNGPSFYAFNASELDQEAMVELVNWFDNSSLDQLLEVQYSRSEYLETLEVEVPIKKVKERELTSGDRPGLFETKEDSFWALRDIGINMTAQAAEQRFRRAYHRDELVERLMQVLMGERNNSVLLAGESESGKTAVVQELVRRMHRRDVPEPLQDREVWMLAPDRIIAGAQYIGTWEERIQDLVNECRKKQHILYVTDLPGLLEIGRWSKSDSNVGLALKPHIATGEVIVIGEASHERLLMAQRQGADFINLFRRIDVPSMTEDEALAVTGYVARDLERIYDVRIDPSASEAATQLTRRFLPYRAFPGKAIRLLEEAVTDVAHQQNNLSNSPPASSLLRRISRRAIRRQEVLDAFSRHSGMPEFIINDRSRLSLEDVQQYFLERVSGQDQVISGMVNLIATVKAGLNDPDKPLGTFLFIGPTGVGKTHMAKTLATYLFGDEDRLIRFDMSEYSDVDGVARLIGAFTTEGELTKRVRTQPFSVVLLDEFEKASPRIYDIFLQVLGEGRLTDASGRTTFFHNTIIILTSNLGSSAGSLSGFGFGKDSISHAEINQTLAEHYRDQIERYFRPEFVNRIDQVVVFGQLHPDALRKIAARELRQILQRDGITRRNLLVEIEDDVIDLVLRTGYSPQFGARPLKREIERIVVSPLARQLAQHSVEDRQLLRIGVDSDSEQLTLKTVPIEDASTTVAIASGLDEADIQLVQMDTAQILEGYAVLRRKLADWMESDLLEQMNAQKAALLAATQSVDFWSKGEDTSRKLARFYFLDRVITHLNLLYERCEYLEDLAVLVNRERDTRYQTDLARSLQDMQRDVIYLEIEMQTGHLPHRHRAMMLLNTIGDNQRTDWALTLTKMYLEWSERKDYDHEVFALTQGQRGKQFTRVLGANHLEIIKELDRLPPVEELAVCFEGSNAFGFLKGERGLHQRRVEPRGDDLARVRVFAVPDNTNIRDWLNDYQRINTEIQEGRRSAPAQEKQSIIRIYSFGKPGDRYARDTRTGIRNTRVKDVIEKGQLDEFILALLRQEGVGVDWEDRFPPTFPF